MSPDDTDVRAVDEGTMQVGRDGFPSVISSAAGLADERITVLHVDDDPSVAETTAEYLERSNDRITVQTTTSADRGLEILEEDAIDCVVSDYQMAEMDGLTLFEEVRSRHPSLPFILFTGRGNEEVASEAVTAGVTDYIRKESGTDQYHVLANQIVNSVQHARSQQLRNLFQAAVEHTGHSVYITDADGVIRYVNPTFESVTGYTADEAIGRTPRILKSGEHGEQFYRELWETILNGNIWRDTLINETKDGEQYIVDQTITPIKSDSGEIEWFVAINNDITEQKERERQLDAIFNNTYQFTGLLDPDGTLLRVNDATLEFGGLDRDEILGEPFWEADWWQIDEETPQRVREAIEQAASGEFVRYEVEVQGESETAIIDFSIRPVTNEQGEVTLLIPEGNDITERKRLGTFRQALQTTASDLLRADSEAEICERAVEAGTTIIDEPLAVAYLYDPESGKLHPEAWTPDLEQSIDTPPVIGGGTPTWQAFVEGEIRYFEELKAGTGPIDFEIPARSILQIPLGEYGILLLANTKSGSITEMQRESAEILRSNVTAALERTKQEQTLREQEYDLQKRREQLERLNRINTVVRNIAVAVVQESEKEEIEQTALEQFIAVDPFEFAWIGGETLDGVSIQTWAGASDSPPIWDEELSVESAHPAIDAYRTGEIQAFQNLMETDDSELELWKTRALHEGYSSCCAVPLIYSETVRGVLMLYANQPNVFDEELQAVLRELGEIIGYALTAIERQYALESERVVELTFSINGETPVFARLAEDLDCAIELKKTPDETDSTITYLFEGAHRDDLSEVVASTPEVTQVRTTELDERTTLVELSTVGEWFGSVFTSKGGRVVAANAEPDAGGQIVARIPLGIDVRTVVESFQSRYPETELLAKEELEGRTRTVQGLRERLEDELTDKQLTVLQTAYSAGYFTQPRQSTGQEIADVLDITQPTFNQHLRSAERKLLDLLLGT
jgi:PAS domain S-box-containing protein